jgi:hypothetical protein
MAKPVTAPESRFFDKVVWNGGEDECWTWQGARTSAGYGHLRGRSQTETILAHRLAYELFVGPVPVGRELDHTCHNDSDCEGGPGCVHRLCVNPAHLEVVTPSVNARRGRTGTRPGSLAALRRG